MKKKKNFIKKTSVFMLGTVLFSSFILLNIACSLFLGGFKIDLSAGKQYSLSEQSREVVQSLKAPVTVRVFISEELEGNYPELAQYSRYLLRFLEQYRRAARVPFEIEVVAVTPFSPGEKDALANRIRPFIGRDGRTNLYLGAAFRNADGTTRIIPYFSPERQNYLEQDISRNLAHFVAEKKKTIGIVSNTLPVINMPEFAKKREDWAFVRVLENDYDVEKISSNAYDVGFYDAVIVINPQKLKNNLRYALDQYLLNGGSLLVFMDPFAEMDLYVNDITTPDVSDFTPFLKKWGLNYIDNAVAGDESLAQPALLSAEEIKRVEDYPYWMKIGKAEMNSKSEITRNINKIIMKTPGIIELANPFEANKITILLNTTAQGGITRSDFVKYNPREVSKQAFKSDGYKYNLAVLSEGKFLSNFEMPLSLNPDALNKLRPFKLISDKEGRLLVVSDSDMLATANWSENLIKEDETIYDLLPQNNNIDFLLAAVDYLAGNGAFPVIGGKFNYQTSGSIEKILRKKYEDVHADEIYSLKNKVLYAKNDISKLNRIVENPEGRGSAEILRRLDQKRRALNDAEQDLKYIDYEINKHVQESISLIIWFNVLVWPVLILIFVLCANIFYKRKAAAAAGRLCHER